MTSPTLKPAHSDAGEFSLDQVIETVAQRVIDNNTAWPAVLRPDALCRYLGISKPRLYNIKRTDPAFPREIRFTNRCVGWRRAAVDAWLEVKERGEA